MRNYTLEEKYGITMELSKIACEFTNMNKVY